MKRGFSPAASLVACLLASACAAVPDAPPPPPRVLAADYSTTYFEYRNGGREFLIPPIVGAILNTERFNRRGERQAANIFERRLGDFDTSDYFLGQLEARFGDSHHFQLIAAKDPVEQQKAIQFIRFNDDGPEAIQLPLPGGGTANAIAGFKVVYGLGMKEGTEQFGFRKTYRVFIRLNAMIKDAHTGEIIWRESIIAFGDKDYEGRAVEYIDGAELTATLKDLTPKVIDLAMRSLNGEELPPMPKLFTASVLGQLADQHDF